MKCPKCNRPMVQLLTSYVCDHCDKKTFENDIQKLMPREGDLLIVKMPDGACDEDFERIADLINGCELDVKCLILPHNIDIEHIKLRG